MASEGPFIAVSLRAFALATEVEERVLAAMRFASCSDEVSVTRTVGHFGTPMAVFEAEFKKARDIRRFMGHLDEFGIRVALAGQAADRVDEERVFHFRLDKQLAYRGKLALAAGHDVIDVRMKVGVYPADRDEAVRAVADWLGSAED